MHLLKSDSASGVTAREYLLEYTHKIQLEPRTGDLLAAFTTMIESLLSSSDLRTTLWTPPLRDVTTSQHPVPQEINSQHKNFGHQRIPY